MTSIFESLTNAVQGSPPLAVGSALLWGILSVVLSPCHLASIPLIVAFVDREGRTSTRRAFTLSVLFSLGILVTIAGVGAITAAAGRIMGDVGSIGNYAVAVIFFILGLHFLGVIPLPWSGPGQMDTRLRGPLAALFLGLVFGIAVGPCTFAFMAPMLGVTFKLASSNVVFSVLLLLCYGLGHCVVIVLAGTFTKVVQRYLNWNERSQGTRLLRAVCGVLVLVAGVYLLYTAS
ncbi:cytochrome c biogenesis CcdA family protein [Candidatus Eisenbacteria bacterium]|uniref:Cytochrome c biogenesis CcdA family protein n=1 Tax=Eiseniibacteriota bacterium TaxID=2212470 RepID=A0ABV6YJ78_UNCEI